MTSPGELTRFCPLGVPKTRPAYPSQLRSRLIELTRAGRTREELGRQFKPSAQTIRNWLTQADRMRAGAPTA